MTVSGGLLRIDAAAQPTRVSHWWTLNRATANWRSRSAPGKKYLVLIEFRTIGAAAIRIGLDRYTPDSQIVYNNDCNWAGTQQDHSNCEDYNSDWYQSASESFVTALLPVF